MSDGIARRLTVCEGIPTARCLKWAVNSSTIVVNRRGKTMTDENRARLARINSYAENVLGDIDPQKVQVSVQLEKLKPIMEEIAKEKNMSLEDMFILYMDLQSEASIATNKKLEESLQDLNDGFDGGSPLLFR